MIALTVKLKPASLVPSGNIVVVMPEPPGQVNSRLSSLIVSPIWRPVIAAPTVQVATPATLSYWNALTVYVFAPERQENSISLSLTVIFG